MVHSVLAYGTNEQPSYNRGLDVLVPHNVLRAITVGRWTLTGTEAGLDVTAGTYPVRRAYDGHGTRGTRFLGTSNTIYLNFGFPASIIDTIGIIFMRSYPTSTVTVQIADDGAFTTNVVDFAGPFTGESGCRIVRSLNGTRRQGVEHLRIRFVSDSGDFSGSLVPEIVECFVGRGYVLSVGWEPGSDLAPRQSASVDYEASTGHVERYPRHFGRYLTSRDFLFGSVRSELDDVLSMRAVRDNSRELTRPLLYLDDHAHDARNGLLVFGPQVLDLQRTAFDVYELSGFDIKEQPPYYAEEACVAMAGTTELLTRARGFYGPQASPTGAGVADDGWGELEGMGPTFAGNTPVLATSSQAASTPRLEDNGTTATAGFIPSNTDEAIGLVGSGTVGGFDLLIRFCLVNDPGGYRCLVGVKEDVGLFNILSQEPTALTGLEFVAFGFPSTDSASADWHLYHSSGGGSVTDIDTNLPRNATSVFEVRIRSERGSGSVRVDLRDLADGATYSATISTNLPSGSTPLFMTTSSRHPSNTSVGTAVVGSWLL